MRTARVKQAKQYAVGMDWRISRTAFRGAKASSQEVDESYGGFVAALKRSGDLRIRLGETEGWPMYMDGSDAKNDLKEKARERL
jgi:hypothetical protein